MNAEEPTYPKYPDLPKVVVEDHRLFQAVFDQMPSGVVIAEAPSGRVLFYNREAGRLLRHPVVEAANYTEYGRFRAVHSDGTPYDPEEYPGAKALAGRAVQEEMRYHLGDGNEAILSVEAAPVRDGDGRVIATVTTFHDISALKRTEAELRESRKRLSFILENSDDNIFLQGPDLRYLWVTKPAVPFTREEYLGNTDLEMDGPREELERLTEIKRRVLERGEVVSLDMGFHPKGEYHFYRATFKPWLDESGEIVGLAGYVRDATEEKHAMDRLKESESRFRMMADNLPLIVWLHDAEGNQEFVNETFAEFFGVNREEMRDGRWRMLMHPDDADEYSSAFIEACKNRTSFDKAVRVKRGDGEWRWLRSWAKPRFDGQGQYLGHVGTSADITDQRSAEETLRRSREVLEQMVDERTEALKRQARRLRAVAWQASTAEQRERKRLAAMLHDELQQYLVAAKIKVYRTRRRLYPGNESDDLDDAIRMIEQAVDSSRNLTHELRPPVLYEAGLVPALRWLASEMQRRHQLDTEVEAGAEGVALSQEGRAFLYSAVQELLFNVVKHATNADAVVRIDTVDRNLLIVVEDNGVGLDVASGEDNLEGMGLFSIRERLVAFGGSMDISSAPGRGTKVTLTVPGDSDLVENAFREPTESATHFESSTTAATVLTGGEGDNERRDTPEVPRVLLVDDHIIVRMGIATLLQEDGRIAVCGEAATAEEAIERIRLDLPDVVLMDINLSGEVNGIEATKTITHRFPKVAVIGLSVQDDESSVRSILEAGASEFVSKSQDAEDIREAILRVLRIGKE